MSRKSVWNKINGNEETAYSHPLRPQEFVYPEGATDVEPPFFDRNTHTCFFNGSEWVLSEIPTPILEPEPEPEPEPDPLTAVDLMRLQRDLKLKESDWRMSEDYPYQNKQLWKEYRQVLRDIPANSTPSYDDNGEITGVDWPTPPST